MAGQGGSAQPSTVHVDDDGNTVIIVQQQQSQGGRPPPVPGAGAAYAIAFAAPLLVAALLIAGHGAVDDYTPDTDRAANAYLLAIVVGLGAAIGAAFVPFRWLVLPLGGLASIVVAFWLYVMLDNYGPNADVGMPVLLTIMLAYIVMGILAAALGSGRDGGPATVLAFGLALALGGAWAGMALLAGLDGAAVRAEAEWSRNTPGVGALVALAVMVAGAGWRQRRQAAKLAA